MKDNSPLMILLIFMLLSVFWSSIPLTSFFRWVREVQAVIMALIILSEPSPQQAILSILRRTTYVLIPFSVLLIKYFPDYGVAYGRWTGEQWWNGVTQQKNGLGLLCFVSAFYLIWSLTRRWQAKVPRVFKFELHTEIVLLILVAWLMRGPQGDFFYSATSFYTLIVGLLSLFGLKAAKKYKLSPSDKTLMAIISLIYAFGIFYFFSGGSPLSILVTAAGRDATLTGRASVWASLVPVAMKSPILGMGFGGFWTPTTQKLFQISGAHSGYLDVLLALGFAGLLIVLIFLLSSCRKAHRALTADLDWGVLWVCMILMTVVYNITESSIDSLTSFLTAIVLFLTVSPFHPVPPREILN
jgi:exopolysaccharide production protein ExoQ